MPLLIVSNFSPCLGKDSVGAVTEWRISINLAQIILTKTKTCLLPGPPRAAQTQIISIHPPEQFNEGERLAVAE